MRTLPLCSKWLADEKNINFWSVWWLESVFLPFFFYFSPQLFRCETQQKQQKQQQRISHMLFSMMDRFDFCLSFSLCSLCLLDLLERLPFPDIKSWAPPPPHSARQVCVSFTVVGIFFVVQQIRKPSLLLLLRFVQRPTLNYTPPASCPAKSFRSTCFSVRKTNRTVPNHCMSIH